MLGRKYLTVPPPSPEMRRFPLELHSRFRTPWSQACRIVSKLNVNPFHSVNSPDDEPVSNLRDDGSHETQLTGVLILLVDVCTRCGAADDAGDRAAAAG